MRIFYKNRTVRSGNPKVIIGIVSLSIFLTASSSLCFAEPEMFIRGNANHDQTVDIADVIYSLNYLFLSGQAPVCLDHADSNDDGFVNLADSLATFNTLFFGLNQIAPFYPEPFYDWTNGDANTCGDVPEWLRDMLQDGQAEQPPPDPDRDPFEEPGLFDDLPESNPITQAVELIRLMSPEEWNILFNTNQFIFETLYAIHQIEFNSINDYAHLLDLLSLLSGQDSIALIINGVPPFVAGVLADAISAADQTTPEELQSADQQQQQSVKDRLTGKSPGLYNISSGPEVNPDDPLFCYICGQNCTAATNQSDCGMKMVYDIYFSPASTPGETAMAFINQLVNEAKKNTDSCCHHEVYVRIPDTSDTVGANGKAAADSFKEEISKIAGNAANGDQCTLNIIFNLYCFSASCTEVIHFAQNLEPCDSPCPGCHCCGGDFDKIKKSINIVSMEGLFDGAPVPVAGAVANLCTGLIGGILDIAGSPGAYACSAVSEQYGGAQPACVCSFNAYSRGEGAGSTDPNLSDWSITSHQIDSPGHAEIPTTMINNPDLWDQIKPGCECKAASPPAAP